MITVIEYKFENWAFWEFVHNKMLLHTRHPFQQINYLIFLTQQYNNLTMKILKAANFTGLKEL